METLGQADVKDLAEMDQSQLPISSEDSFTSEELVSSEELILMEIESAEIGGHSQSATRC